VFFDEDVDIHHIFPQDWCKGKGIKREVYDSIINKTPLSSRTNQIVGRVAPSAYLEKLETGNARTPPIAPQNLDGYLGSHLIDPALLRADKFEAFMTDRQERLLRMIEQATRQKAYRDQVSEDEAETDDGTDESGFTI
jgi:hypothetical protein